MREEFGTLEPVSAQALAELERDRVRARGAAMREVRLPSRRGPEPIQHDDGETLGLPEIPQPPPRTAAPVEVEFGAHITLSLHANRLDLDTARRQGRDRVRQRMEQARSDFAQSETMAQVQALRQRRQAAGRKLAEASQAVQKATEEHAAAAGGETADAGKLWKAVLRLRDDLAGADAAATAVASQLNTAETHAAEVLAQRMETAIAAERQMIQETREQLTAELLEVLRPKIEALHREREAAGELVQQARFPALLPAS